jgi:hypothetical protein
LARAPIRDQPIGVYDEPSPPDAAPQVTSIHIPDFLPGTVYAQGVHDLETLTKLRDKLADVLSSVIP